MYSPTTLSERLSFFINQTKDEPNTSEFTDEEERLLTNAVRKFIADLNHYPSDYKVKCSDIVDCLDLISHPEGGFYRRFSWTKEKSKTFYLLPKGSVSSWHRLKGIRETWKWLHGGVLLIPQISYDFRWIREDELTRDNDVVIMNGLNNPEGFGDWFGAYRKDGDYSLVLCECSPPFEFSRFEMVSERDVNHFKAINPDRAEIIELVTKNAADKMLSIL